MKKEGFSRLSKDLIIGQLVKELEKKSTFFVTEYSTVSAMGLDRLRSKLRTANTRYFVIKKSLGKKALEKANIAGISESLSGSCAIAFASGDPVQPSKILVEFIKENEAFKIKSAYLNGRLVTVDQVKQLASLPSKEVLVARVVGGIQAPISRFVNVLSGSLRKVVTAIDAIAKKKSAA